MELSVLESRVKEFAEKLKQSNVHLEVFDANDIEYGATLGKGGEGLVQCCMIKYNGLRIKAAAKTAYDYDVDHSLEEIELLCLAQDPIVTTTIKVYGMAAVPDDKYPEIGHLIIITEAGLMNSLQLYQTEDIPLHVTYDIWRHLAAALHCIHTKKIIHQDLKPENILVTEVHVKFIDLGMAKLVEGDQIDKDCIVGTEGYHAPEVLLEDMYGFRADIFVLGITFCILLLPRSSRKTKVLRSILATIHNAKLERFVGSGLFNYFISPLFSNHLISSEMKSLICEMLECVDKRSITLLQIAARCHKEAAVLRQQLVPETAGRMPSYSESFEMGKVLQPEPSKESLAEVQQSSTTPLILADAEDQTTATEQFTRIFRARYGDTHPVFFIGSLKGAAKEASASGKLLAIYLHHDESAFASEFCSQILCTQTVVSFLRAHFIIWAWDLTNDSNKKIFLQHFEVHLGNAAVRKVETLSTDTLPLLLAMSKNGRTNEVSEIIEGRCSLIDLMTRLIAVVEKCEQQKTLLLQQDEKKEVRSEKDLINSQPKVTSKRQEEEEDRTDQEIKKMRVEEKEQEKEREEEERKAELQATALNLTMAIRIRCADGQVLAKNVSSNSLLRDLLSFLTSEGFYMADFKLLQMFPRRDLTLLDPSLTLADLHFSGQETLILERI